MKYSDKEVFLIVIDSVFNLEYKYKYAIYEKTKNIEDFCEKQQVALLCAKEISDKEIAKSVTNLFSKEYIEYTLSELEKSKTVAITIDSDDYPNSLKEIDNPPLVLYAKGNISLLKQNCFSVVGSRKSLPLSISIAEDFSERLIEGGFTLVTGIAEGIDVTVLKKCVSKDACAISVLAGGLGNIYPKAHKNIFDKVCEKGLVISEHTFNTQAMPYMFPIRNRIIAGLSKGTLVVNGNKKSGALYTAEFAMENGRDLFAVPYSIGINSGEGTNDLIKRGAILVDSPDDILDYYGIEKVERINQVLSEKEKSICSQIEKGKYHIEEIASELNLSITDVSTTLSLMEIKKIVVKDGINQYSLIK